MAVGALLWMLAMHLMLTGLPGVGATLLAAKRGVRSVPGSAGDRAGDGGRGDAIDPLSAW